MLVLLRMDMMGHEAGACRDGGDPAHRWLQAPPSPGTSLPSTRPSGDLLLAPGGAGELDAVGVVDEAVEDGVSHGRLPDPLVPLLDR